MVASGEVQQAFWAKDNTGLSKSNYSRESHIIEWRAGSIPVREAAAVDCEIHID